MYARRCPELTGVVEETLCVCAMLVRDQGIVLSGFFCSSFLIREGGWAPEQRVEESQGDLGFTQGGLGRWILQAIGETEEAGLA